VALLPPDPVGPGAGRESSGLADLPSGTVTFLFTDIEGSTELLRQLGEDYGAVAEEHRALLRDEMEPRGGREVDTQGDSFFFAFRRAKDAAAAAASAQRALAAHMWPRSVRVRVRMGMHTGEPSIGGEGYVGLGVHRAARIMALARGGQVLLSQATRSVIEDDDLAGMAIRELGEFRLKGFDRPERVYELQVESRREPSGPVREVPAPGPRGALPAALARVAERPFVARSGELARIEAAHQAAARGEARVVAVAGEPGIGKTSLVAAGARRAHAEGASVLLGRCHAEALVPYEPFVEALRHLPTELLAERADVLARVMPELAPNLVSQSATDDPAARYLLFEAVARTLEAGSGSAPLVLVLEDLHWADAPTLLLLKHTLRVADQAPLLVLATYRTTEAEGTDRIAAALSDIARELPVDRVAVSGLGAEEVAELIGVLEGHPPTEALGSTMRRDTAGNPLFVGQLLRHLADTGALVEHDGEVGLSASARGLGVPDSVKELVGRRLAALPADSGEALSTAAVIGRSFHHELLAAVQDQDPELALDALEAGVAAGLVDRVGADRHAFAHTLVREAIYERMGAPRRARVHRRVAESLEAAGGADPPELALHFLAAGDRERGLAYSVASAERALLQFAYEDAAAHFRRALEALGDEDPSRRCELLLALGDAQARAGEGEEARSCFLDAAALASAHGMPEALARAALGYGGRFVWARAGADRELVPLLERALGALSQRDSVLRARVLARLAGALRDEPDQERRDRLSAEAVEMARRLEDPQALAYVLDGRYCALMWPENPAERLEIADEIVALSEAVADDERAIQGLIYGVISHLELGHVPEAEARCEATAERAAALRQPAQIWFAAAMRATLALFAGRFGEAEELIEHALRLGERAQRSDAVLSHRLQRFLLCRETGRMESVEELIERAVAEYPRRAVFRCFSACIHVELGRHDQGRRLVRELAADDFAVVHRDNEFLFALSMLADGVRELGDVQAAGVLYGLLAPCAHLNASNADELATGSVARPLGVLAGMLGRWGDAMRHFDAAAAHNEAMSARPWVAHTHHDHGRMLLARGDRRDVPRAAELLSQAISVYAELGMESWVQRARSLGAGTAQPYAGR
jgi:class 3 adenylate cyclase/tetratricopeptide (TPR) repeat protein